MMHAAVPATAYMTGYSARACARCGKELTDAASMEAGIGPVCRKLDNALLAAKIPSDLKFAIGSFKAIDAALLAAPTMATLVEVESALFADDAGDCTDWRKTVKRVEWLLSWPTTPANAAALIGIVIGLGYIGLGSLLSGDASTGKTTITCESGRLYLSGPRNKAGAKALKAIAGWKFHPADGEDKARWSVPAKAGAALRMAVLSYWPNHEGLDAALLEAATVLEAATPPPAPAKPKCAVTEANGTLWVVTPYHPGFIAALKSLPYKDRGWDPGSKAWRVSAAHEAAVKKMIAEAFGPEAL